MATAFVSQSVITLATAGTARQVSVPASSAFRRTVIKLRRIIVVLLDRKQAALGRCAATCGPAPWRASAESGLVDAYSTCYRSSPGRSATAAQRGIDARVWSVLPGGQGRRSLCRALDATGAARIAMREHALQRFASRRAVDVTHVAEPATEATGGDQCRHAQERPEGAGISSDASR